MDKLKNILNKVVEEADPINLSISKSKIEEATIEKYVINTDKGYIKGDMHKGIEFVDRDHARKFSLFGLHAYWDSICSDMYQFFDCEFVESEEIN